MAHPFPESFLFGAGTSAFQIEGALHEDGRGPSVWDDFPRRRGGDTGDVACDHYHRVAEDVALMKELGLGAYRFSIAWPRILPRGRGAVNQAGLDFYARLVDALLAAGIAPFATLYHWDLPSALGDAGGWESRDTAQAFGEYAAVVARALGDRLPYVSTLNEPSVMMFQGYIGGNHPPGHKGVRGSLKAMGVQHHLLLAHAYGVQAWRAAAPKTKLGITNALAQVYPWTSSNADREAADTAQQLNHLFLQAIFEGQYHKALTNPLLGLKKHIRPGDMATIATPIDFIGVNCYTRARVKKARFSVLGYDGITPEAPRDELTDMGWEVAPQAIYDILQWVHRAYPSARLFVTENGAAYPDVVVDGAVDDPLRERYLARHLAEVQRAVDDGCPVDGYFVWSLLDNFEWTHGYGKRFGLVYVDYPTQRRIIKRSGRWYQRVCRARGL